VTLRAERIDQPIQDAASCMSETPILRIAIVTFAHPTCAFRYVVPVGNSILLATDIESGDAPALCQRSVA
jgi:hypothetical protein